MKHECEIIAVDVFSFRYRYSDQLYGKTYVHKFDAVEISH